MGSLQRAIDISVMQNNKPIVLHDIGIYEEGIERKHCDLVIENNQITYADIIDPQKTWKDHHVINGQELWAAPGLVDVQLNGGWGYYFSNDPERVRDVAQKLPSKGVTSFLPTLISCPLESYSQKLSLMKAVKKEEGASRILGAHLEGPFLSKSKPGAHNQDYLLVPSAQNLEKLGLLDEVKMITLAPELPNALLAIHRLVEKGVVVSIGHSMCDANMMRKAEAAGATCATHIFNGMPTLHHREPGMVAPLLTDETMFFGLIADGIHVHPEILRLIYKCRGMRGIMLVTDAMGALGMSFGRYKIGEQDVTVDKSGARLKDGRLAGSTLSMDNAVRNMVEYCGCTPAQAIRMASTTPVEVLGMAHKLGHIKPGYLADIVLFDAELNVQAVFVDGLQGYVSSNIQKRFIM